MNFLFDAVLISLLLLPGVILRVSYLNISHGKKTFKTTFVEEIFVSLILTFFIHFIGYILTEIIFLPLDEKTLFLLLINSEKTIDFGLNSLSVKLFFVYCTVTYLTSWFLGAFFRKKAISKSWDVNYPIFRLHNDWYYILRGIIEEDENGKKSFRKVNNVWVDVLVESKESSLIYSGFLYEFILSREEGLDRIYLSGVRRRKLSDDTQETKESESRQEDSKEEEPASLLAQELGKLIKEKEFEIDYDENEMQDEQELISELVDKRYYDMPGDNFVIPYSQIKNINIFYFDETDTSMPRPEL